MFRVALCVLLSVYLTCLHPASAISTPESPSYHAGVVEYFKARNVLSPRKEADENLKNYITFIHAPEADGLDILVFPESSLNNRETAAFVPEPEDNVNPCTDSTTEWDPLVKDISCAARATKKYVVINLTEKSLCPDKQQGRLNDTRPCPESKINQYNANVIFNRDGVVVSKYRKFNLFGEKGILHPIRAESVPLKTDFGVTFGQFICFDLMFDKPALDLVKAGVTDFLFPTMWFSELPFLDAVQPQQGWAFKHNVNFLAAGASFPPIGSTGSGIYNGRKGTLTSLMSDLAVSKILRAEVPKIGSNLEPKRTPQPEISPEKMLKLRLKRDQLDPYNSSLVVPDRQYSTEICSGPVCCQFSVEVEFWKDLLTGKPNEDFYKYRLAAFDGVRTFDGFADGGVKVCAVFACTDDTLASCGKRFDGNVSVVNVHRFKSITIKTAFNPEENLLVIPNTLDTSIMPLEPTHFQYEEHEVSETETTASMTLLKDVTSLYTFAIYGRDFSRDKKTFQEQ